MIRFTKHKWTTSLLVLCLVNTTSIFAVVKPKIKTVATTSKTTSTTQPISEAFRHKSPELPGPRPFKLAAVTTYSLPNGLSVQLLPDHRVPFVTAMMGVNAGSTLDPKPLLGLAGMTADMLTEGTTSRTSKKIADEVDFIGGGLSATATHDYVVINASALSKYTPKLFDLFSDVVLQPNFPDDELKLKRANSIQELSIKRSEPDFLLEERFHKATFGDHPYSVIAPTEETLNTMTKDELAKVS